MTIEVSWQRQIPKEVDSKSVVMDEFKLHNSDEKVVFQRDGYLEVSVKDSGVGMTDAQLRQLFHPGVQFNANELQAGKGSGLGLYIAKGICERHGGSLAAESDGLGKGTTFTFTIPLHHVPDEALPARCKHLRLGKSPSNRKNTLDHGNLRETLSGISPNHPGGQLPDGSVPAKQ